MQENNMNIRVVNVTDMLTIHDLICKLEECAFDISIFENIFLKNINDSNIIYLVAENSKGELVGFISSHIQYLLHHCGKVAEIQELYVLEAYRNLGIGLQLMNRMEEKIIGLDCVSMEVTAQNKRINTHHFYIKCGLDQSHLKFTKQLIS